MFDEKLINTVVESKVRIKLSVYGHIAEVHDSVTNVSGSFIKLTNTVVQLVDAGVSVSAAVIIMRENEDYVNEIIQYCNSIGMKTFSYEGNENENVRVKSGESRVNAIFRHVRNAFAHGNTYFFENGMCLLEDMDGKKISAELLIPNRSLLEWIQIVDKNGLYYTCNNLS